MLPWARVASSSVVTLQLWYLFCSVNCYPGVGLKGGGGGCGAAMFPAWPCTHPQVGGDERGEDLGHGLLVELVHGHNVEVTQEARCHGVAAAPRGPHGCDELDVLQSDLGGVLQVIPAWKTRPSVGTLGKTRYSHTGTSSATSSN